jgi:hypothetical protein
VEEELVVVVVIVAVAEEHTVELEAFDKPVVEGHDKQAVPDKTVVEEQLDKDFLQKEEPPVGYNHKQHTGCGELVVVDRQLNVKKSLQEVQWVAEQWLYFRLCDHIFVVKLDPMLKNGIRLIKLKKIKINERLMKDIFLKIKIHCTWLNNSRCSP